MTVYNEKTQYLVRCESLDQGDYEFYILFTQSKYGVEHINELIPNVNVQYKIIDYNKYKISPRFFIGSGTFHIFVTSLLSYCNLKFDDILPSSTKDVRGKVIYEFSSFTHPITFSVSTDYGLCYVQYEPLIQEAINLESEIENIQSISINEQVKKYSINKIYFYHLFLFELNHLIVSSKLNLKQKLRKICTMVNFLLIQFLLLSFHLLFIQVKNPTQLSVKDFIHIISDYHQ